MAWHCGGSECPAEYCNCVCIPCLEARIDELEAELAALVHDETRAALIACGRANAEYRAETERLQAERRAAGDPEWRDYQADPLPAFKGKCALIALADRLYAESQK